MKKHLNFWNIVLILSLAGVCYCAYDYYKHTKFVARVDKMNSHIKQLHEDGYTWEAARKIGATEAGFIPIDAEYTALKED